MEIKLDGTQYTVLFRVWRKSRTYSSRGDHGMGGGDYERHYWVGDVTVRNKEGECLAACSCGLGETESWAKGEKDIRRLMVVDDIPSDKQADYANFMAERIIRFSREDRSDGMPHYPLEAPEQESLITRGIILDANEQIHIGLG